MGKGHMRFILVSIITVSLSSLILFPRPSLAQEFPGPPRKHGATQVARAMAGGQVHLGWDAPDPAASTGGGQANYYRVYRHELPFPVPLNWVLIADDSSNTLVKNGLAGQPQKWYVDTTAVRGKRYAYQIKGVDETYIDEEGPQLLSGDVTINTTADPLYFYLDTGSHGGTAEFRYDATDWKIESAKRLDPPTTHA